MDEEGGWTPLASIKGMWESKCKDIQRDESQMDFKPENPRNNPLKAISDADYIL